QSDPRRRKPSAGRMSDLSPSRATRMASGGIQRGLRGIMFQPKTAPKNALPAECSSDHCAQRHSSVARAVGKLRSEIVPDVKYPGLYRIRRPDGSLTDMTNPTRAKEALSWS